METRVKASGYIEWAKTRSQATFNLATSGVMNYPMAELPATLEDIELSGPSWYGYEPLQRALAAKCGVDTDNIVAAIGTSMANYLVMATILDPGDEVVIEQPAYDPLVSIARYLGAEVKRFERRFEDDFRVDPGILERSVTSRTRLIVMTNMHNPSSALVDTDTLREVGEIARRVGARVMVDEVYLEALFDEARPYAFPLGSQFVTTSSLTKAYGLSGLRCGWIVADAELARRIWRLNDLFGNIPAHSAERLSVIALANLDAIKDRARSLLNRNRVVLDQFLDTCANLETVRPPFGTVVFPRVKRGTVDELCSLLRRKYETSVVHGKYFEMPDHIRIGIGCDSEMLERGLERLGSALDELKSPTN
ncbi:MAG TPA: aminotransferase class I/II-fold pyridoxal phosphate-dependent enzyme [Blastocatellia bacterium]|nr:aminotransferase class I/II-fold pyridoxal phosphate-dependent enzyme [Blastocatellia bacterium]